MNIWLPIILIAVSLVLDGLLLWLLTRGVRKRDDRET